jgi:hypothetical protein
MDLIAITTTPSRRGYGYTFIAHFDNGKTVDFSAALLYSYRRFCRLVWRRTGQCR